MSDEHDNRTEPASEQRLRRAREEGQIALGRDAPLVAGVAAGAVALAATGGALQASLVALLHEAASQVARAPFTALPGLALRPAAAVLAVVAAAAVAAAAVSVAQTRGGFWPHLAAPDLSRLFQARRLGRLFSGETALDLALAIAKVAAVAGAVWAAARDEVRSVPALLRAEPSAQLGGAFALLRAAAKPALAAALALAVAEWAVARARFAKRMRMTKEELKRESKEDEGDPLLRGARRRRHRDLSRGQARKEVPRADALVVNPTHVAVAIRYRRGEGRAPRVVAKGKGALAEYMRALAREHGVPIVQDVPLARLLYRKVKVGREIPAQTYKAVATVLAFVYRVTGRAQRA